MIIIRHIDNSTHMLQDSTFITSPLAWTMNRLPETALYPLDCLKLPYTPSTAWNCLVPPLQFPASNDRTNQKSCVLAGCYQKNQPKFNKTCNLKGIKAINSEFSKEGMREKRAFFELKKCVFLQGVWRIYISSDHKMKIGFLYTRTHVHYS